MDTKIIYLFVAATINLVMAVYIFFKNRQSPINISFTVFLAGASLWSFGIAMFMQAVDMSEAIAWARIYYFAAAVIILSFVFFAIHYIYPFYRMEMNKMFYILIPFLFITFIIFHPTFFLSNATHSELGNNANENIIGHIIFAIYFFAYLIFSYFILFKKRSILDGIMRWNINCVIFGTMASFIIGVTSDLVVPLFGSYRYIYVGPYFTLINTFAIIYLIFFSNLKIKIVRQ